MGSWHHWLPPRASCAHQARRGFPGFWVVVRLKDTGQDWIGLVGAFLFCLHGVYSNLLPKKMYNVERTVSSTTHTHPSVSTLDLPASLLANPPSLRIPGLFWSKSRHIISLQTFIMCSYHKETLLQSFFKRIFAPESRKLYREKKSRFLSSPNKLEALSTLDWKVITGYSWVDTALWMRKMMPTLLQSPPLPTVSYLASSTMQIICLISVHCMCVCVWVFSFFF